MKRTPSKETLKEQYHGKGMTLEDIATKYNTGTTVVSRWMKAHNIETRDRGTPSPANMDERLKLLRDRSWLKSKLHDEMMHPDDIADHLGYDSTTSVRRWMDNHNLQIVYKDKDALRSAIQEKWYTADEIANSVGRSKQTVVRWARELDVKHRPWQYESVLKELYVGKQKTTHEIAELLGCTGRTVGVWLNKFDIETDRYRYYDEYHDLYNEGWTECRRTVIERDNESCVICNKKSADGTVDVHHIEPVRSFENHSDAHTTDNCICLCRTHHIEVEKNNIDCPEPPQS